MYEKRIHQAVENFMAGYNCAQSVVAAFADLYGLDRKQALLVSASFGAGMGRLRETCGTLSGIVMLAGLETGTAIGEDRAGKSANYAVVQDLVARFRANTGRASAANCSAYAKMLPPHQWQTNARRNTTRSALASTWLNRPHGSMPVSSPNVQRQAFPCVRKWRDSP